MSYRPITDFWFLARPKVAYYGSFPNGFLERALPLIGGSMAPTLHVCGGDTKRYPSERLVANAWTLDLDESLEPDFLQDAREPFPAFPPNDSGWPQILLDPPYTDDDADHYKPGRGVMPTPNQLLRNALDVLAVGSRVGCLHYLLPQPPKKGCKFIACVCVVVGYNNRSRLFSVFEKL